MAAMDRQEYPAMLATLQPSQAIDVLNDRVRQVGRLNSDIADWLQERRKLEEQYAAGLHKLARRSGIADANDLGVFSTPWSALVNALTTLADSHHALAQKIESDVEKPLREFHSSNREMQAMTTIQGNCASMARDIDKAQKSSDKLQGKSTPSTGRIANVSRDLENAQSQWDSQAPYVFETLQALDETRLNHLRDVLTQFQTHEVDQVERSRIAAEQCLNTLLTVETADEIKTFALRTTSGMDKVDRQRSRQSVAIPSSSTPTPQRPSTAGATADDRASQRSDSISDLPPPPKPRGLRRLGTVLSRRRESKIPLGADRISESPERKSPERKSRLQSSSTFSSLSSRMGRSKDTGASSLEPPQEDARERPRSPLRTTSSINDAASEAPTSPPATRFEEPAINGIASTANIPNGSHQNDLTGLQLQEPLQPATPTTARQQPREVTTDNEGFSQRPAALDPISQAQQDAAAERSEPQFKVDIKDAPTSREAGDDDARTSVANTLRMQAPPTAASRRAGTVRGRRENRASVYSPTLQAPHSQIQTVPGPVSEEGPIKEELREIPPESPLAAPSTVQPIPTQSTGGSQNPFSQSSILSPPAASQPPQTIPTQTTGDSQHPISQASTFSPFQPIAGAAAGVGAAGGLSALAISNGPQSPTSPGLAIRPGSQLGEDTQSIRSGRSLSSSASALHKHPELTAPGLNTSVIETVSAWFQNGSLTRSVVIGEVALAHNASDPSKSVNNETIRLDKFSNLDKVAPNPAFLTPIDGRNGEYSLNLAQIARTQVAFKYQISPRVAENGTLAPLKLDTAWKIDATTASAILSYTLNPSFNLASARSITLNKVVLVLHLGGSDSSSTASPVSPTSATASSCQSKPVGTFNKERQCIYWQLGDVTLDADDSSPKKLLARFVTDGEAKAGRVEARWEAVGALGSGVAVSTRGEAEVDPFQDEDGPGGMSGPGWRVVGGVRRLVGGTYQGV